MPTVADALRQHADGYLRLYGDRMPSEHKRVLAAITRCRTGALGSLRYDCRCCRRTHWVGRSCGNRHCPNCQSDKTQVWLAKRTAQLLPVPYYLVTCTVPEALRKIVRANQRACYQAMFDTGSATVRELAGGPRFIGTDRLGFFGALHTWGRDPSVYHPHVQSSVTYKVRPTGEDCYQTRTVSGQEFVRAFLQHTLPRNFQRLRYYGFASPNSKLQFAWVRMLVWFYLGWCYWLAKQAEPEPIEKTPVRCAGHRSPSGGLVGGGVMQLTEITDGSGRVLYNHPLPYLDSG